MQFCNRSPKCSQVQAPTISRCEVCCASCWFAWPCIPLTTDFKVQNTQQAVEGSLTAAVSPDVDLTRISCVVCSMNAVLLACKRLTNVQFGRCLNCTHARQAAAGETKFETLTLSLLFPGLDTYAKTAYCRWFVLRVFLELEYSANSLSSCQTHV